MTSEPFISYAQTMEDVMLWRALRHVGPGFYIDVGAADPDRLSVTRAFYERGWHGIDVEPLPEQAARLQQKRPRDIVVQAALAEAPGTAALYRVEKDGDLGLSTLDRAEADRSGGTVAAIEVPVTTLAALCREHVHRDVHFLKIDVEGAEGAVLRGADFAATRPWIVLVEAARPLTGESGREEWQALLEQAGYVFVWFDGLNRFYLAQEHHDALAPHFLVPPNPFDHYRVADLPRDELLAATLDLSQARLNIIEGLESELARCKQRTAPSEAAETQAPQTSLSIAPDQAAPTTGQPAVAPSRRVSSWAYSLVRPVVRPLGWRLRTFLLAELRDELAHTGAQLGNVSAQLGTLGVLREQLANLGNQLAELRQDLAEMRGREQAILEHVAAIRARPALDADLAEAAEQLLLTLSLERNRP